MNKEGNKVKKEFEKTTKNFNFLTTGEIDNSILKSTFPLNKVKNKKLK